MTRCHSLLFLGLLYAASLASSNRAAAQEAMPHRQLRPPERRQARLSRARGGR